MPEDVLKTPIEYLKGVGPKRADLLKKELEIHSFNDLLHHYPFRYIDKSKIYPISEIQPDLAHVQVIGKIRNIQKIGGRKIRRISALLEDDSGKIELVWFKGLKWIAGNLVEGNQYLVFGKPTRYQSRINIVHPELEPVDNPQSAGGNPLFPVYSSTEKLNNNGMGSKVLAKLVYRMLEQVHQSIPETLPSGISADIKLMPRNKALVAIHFPKSNDSLAQATFRIKFEELFFIQLRFLLQKQINQNQFKGFVFDEIGNKFNTFYKDILPFELTEAQKRVIKEIRKDVGSGKQMNRLLQGDVGSGKTMVAAMSMLIAIDNGFQTCLMAPTEILAKQHMTNISEYLEPIGIRVGLLTGSTKPALRTELLEILSSGECNVIIGTHALLEERVKFKNLGLAVIDEQHRFGVAQRAKLWKKNSSPPHILVMTATPIPRTLAMTLYGDLDVSVIDKMPPGRKPIITSHRTDSSRLRVFGFMEDQIRKGRQVYVVYPLIEESEKMDYKDLMDGFESIERRFPKPKYQVSIVHGRMKSADKDFEMRRFLNKETQILVATSVIEVGVDVPNATVMVIESAERFGLSQLHQLRGRVGRGGDQSYCILMTGHKLTRESKLRMETLVRTNDGFEIAEVDLKLRGPGDFHGTQQSGLPLELKLTNLAKDGQILGVARTQAQKLLEQDPRLEFPENLPAKVEFKKRYTRKMDWARIS